MQICGQSFEVAYVQCEHFHWQQQVLFALFASRVQCGLGLSYFDWVAESLSCCIETCPPLEDAFVTGNDNQR